MKRDIRCLTCRKDIEVALKAESEPYKIVRGHAINNFLCDGCGIELKKDATVYAVSIWHRNHGAGYEPWESEYVTTPVTEAEVA